VRQDVRDAEFSEYVAAHRVRLVRTARLLTAGDEAAAEDLVQTVLTRLYVMWGRVSGADDPVA
jgi:DNA-directed RNA polymerase specialized sigma24 family protein